VLSPCGGERLSIDERVTTQRLPSVYQSLESGDSLKMFWISSTYSLLWRSADLEPSQLEFDNIPQGIFSGGLLLA